MPIDTWHARDRAGRLGFRIWLSLFPHDETLHKAPGKRWHSSHWPAEELRLPLVTDISQVQPGDLLLVVSTDGYVAALTAREAVGRYESAVYRVLSTTAKTIKVQDAPNIPKGGWGGWPPEEFGEVPEDLADTNTNLRVSAPSRKIFRLGSVEDLRTRLQAHPDYEAWTTAFTAAKQEYEEEQASARAAREAAEAEARPKLKAAERINEIAGEELLRVREDFTTSVDPVTPWLAETGRLHIYLHGLYATRKIDSLKVLNEAQQLLKQLGLCDLSPHSTITTKS